ncbi:MAG: RNA-binding protein, partial [Clostridia bacterium]|nr:RNA-binding protein [Clostridia bacterium]
KVLAIDEEGRINLSLKKAEVKENPEPVKEPTAQDIFESKLKAFMQSSESRISDLKHQNDRRSGAKRRK